VPVRVSTSGGFEPRWSTDGRELFYIQGNAMMAVGVETEHELSFVAPKRLFSGSYQLFQPPIASSYDVARDGRFLMIEAPAATGDATPGSIVVVENWAEELKQRAKPRAQ
jgi:hypothetical protein